jgi:hypothetical protein
MRPHTPPKPNTPGWQRQSTRPWHKGWQPQTIRPWHKGWQPQTIRPWHGATNVGAGSARETPRGRRSISRALEKHRLAPGSPDAIPRQAIEVSPSPRRNIASRPPSASRCFSSALKIERRPRGASRAEPAPTFVAPCHGLMDWSCQPLCHGLMDWSCQPLCHGLMDWSCQPLCHGLMDWSRQPLCNGLLDWRRLPCLPVISRPYLPTVKPSWP